MTEPNQAVALEIGDVAASVLRRPGSRGLVLGRFRYGAALQSADGEVIWLDERAGAIGTRGVLLEAPFVSPITPSAPYQVEGEAIAVGRVRIEFGGAARFGPLPLPEAPAISTRAVRTLAHTHERHAPRDRFSAYIDDAVRAFADAVSEGEPIDTAAVRLVGLGPGLTPAGDDVLGGALATFALLAPDERFSTERIRACTETTHVISRARIEDHAHGKLTRAEHALFRPLLSHTADPQEITGAALSLGTFGHGSGWDFIRGVLVGAHLATRKCVRGI